MYQTFASVAPIGAGAGAILAPPPYSPPVMVQVAELAAALLKRLQDERSGPQTWATTEEAQAEVAALLQRAADEGRLRLFEVRPNGQLVALPPDYLRATRRWSGEAPGTQVPAIRSWLEGRRLPLDFADTVVGGPVVFTTEADAMALVGSAPITEGSRGAPPPAWAPRPGEKAKTWVVRPEVQAEVRRQMDSGEAQRKGRAAIMLGMCGGAWTWEHLRKAAR